MKKKKICVLHAQVPFVRGGAELLVENLTRELNERNFDAELVSIPFKWYPNNSLIDSVLAWRMIDLSETNGNRIDLVIGTKFPTYAVNHENKILWLVHQFREAYDLCDNKDYAGLNTIPEGAKTRSKIIDLDNKLIPESKEIYSISKNVTNRLKKYNNIDSIPLYHPPMHMGKYNNESYGNYILSIGRLDMKKRVDLLIKSLTYSDKSVQAYIAGKGPELDKLQKLAYDLQVEDRVKFLGFVNDTDLLKLYANAFAVYFAPVDEDYGYITLEALLSKKPLITCNDSGGVLEFVEDELSAYIVNSNEIEIGEKINIMYNNKNKCKDMGEYGYNNVKDISWDNVIDRLTQTIR
ncbi:glycosyltransferase [Anaerocolumna sp. AGMB13025]|uniref:glycosyltransferase family 4 protein n=1 Tax=Anaerocolumna sp. AGMB13025 TaxID=3039116 RepID=UPI00241F8C67|nr:glycosyltransferase [Anaerocolumna sp. AGMB13025]WFR56317.1 glycosyltransferase [Anaerocolumna sp. AGMB13025]